MSSSNKNLLILVPIVVVILVLINSLVNPNAYTNIDKKKVEPQIEYKTIGDLVETKDWSYKVLDIKYTKTLSKDFINLTSSGFFLIVTMDIRNKTKEKRELDNTLFKLTDGSERVYDVSASSVVIDEIGKKKTIFMKEVAPNAKTSGFIIFEVSKEGTYDFKLNEVTPNEKIMLVRL